MIKTGNIKELLFVDKAAVDAKINEGIDLISNAKIKASAKHIFDAGGKRIRPSIMLTAYKAVGGESLSQAISVAAAMELVHNWSLVHDDIIDKSDLRRGLPTIHKKWNETVAILSGDMLNILAYRMIADAGINAPIINSIMTDISVAAMELIDGELMDVEFETETKVTEQDYFEMISKKTGALFRSSAKIGAILGSTDYTVISALEKYGAKIGIAFQIQDDLLDITGNGDDFGKEIGKDVKEGKKTLMVLHALNHSNEADSSRLWQIINESPASDIDVKLAIEIMERNGSLEYARQTLNTLVEDAIKALDILPFTDHKTVLIELANFIANRNH